MSCWIGIVSQKGGVGKTTVSLNLSVALAERGNRVLLIDTDPQGGVGLSLGKTSAEMIGLWDCMKNEVNINQAIVRTKLPRLSILTRGVLPATQIYEYEHYFFQTTLLQTLKQNSQHEYDVVIVDTPAGLGLVTRKVLHEVDHVLIPSQAEALSYRSLQQAIDVVTHVKANENLDLNLLGILPTMVDRTKDESLRILTEMWSTVGHVLDSSIPRADIFPKASIHGIPLAFMSGALSPEAKRFELLAAEIEERISFSVLTEPKNQEHRTLL